MRRRVYLGMVDEPAVCVAGDKEGYLELAKDIVLQAVKDYKGVVEHLARRPRDTLALAEKILIEEFFASGWYKQLTSIGSDVILAALVAKKGEEVCEGDKG